ncbi:Cyanovirin-N [Mycena epipterygia]|nr:Cyanovirin-N [Mycena epipterygia]
MNTLFSSVFLALCTVAAVPSVLTASLQKRDSISATCRDFVFDASTFALTATCSSPGAGDSISDISLNSCIGNNNGDLAVGGDFSSSCTQINLNGLELSAECQSNSGFTVGSELNLDIAITAVNGVLTC